MLARAACLLALLALAPAPCVAGAPGPTGPVIDSMDELHFRAPAAKATVALVDGSTGKAVRFAFDAGSQSTFCTSSIGGTPAWDRAAGISFLLKGDGSDAFGGLEFIYGGDYGVRYDYAFPLRNTAWTRVTVAWQDLIAVRPGPTSLSLGTAGGNLPSKLSNMAFGRWWYWQDYPAHSFAVDDIRLEPRIVRDTATYRPAGAPLARVLARLRAGKPVTIVTMGDSLTDTHHWSNRETCWPTRLRDALQAKHRSAVTIVNPAIGGTELRTNLVLVPRWLARTPRPDLVTVFFGGNDWESGMRGPQFETTCADAIDRIRRATHGSADVLIMSTAPSVAQWTTRGELAESCRRAARLRKAGLADVERAFLAAGQTDRERLYVWDKVHLGPAGQELAAQVVLRAISAGGR